MVVNLLAQSFNGQLDVTSQVALWGSVALIIFAIVKASKGKHTKNLQNLNNTVSQIQAWMANPVQNESTFLTAKGEKTFFNLENIDLMEYQSTGSTFESVHGGVIFPIVGRVRGVAGVSKGESTKKPEALTPVDKGRVVITDKQIVFIGEKENREWSFDKLVDVQAGPNGLWAKLAASNQKKNAFLQHLEHDQVPVGAAIGIATSWVTGSEETAMTYANNLIAEFNKTIAENTKPAKK
ncbi:MAG: hypothetical protein ACKOWJ_06270 [Micrococcales bacterium]